MEQILDIVTKATRSRMMAGIRNKDTKPEILVRKHLHSLGFRFRLHRRIGKARPDLVLSRWRTCIFVHGCYWHRHEGCKLASKPKSNTAFWKSKFNQNVERDKRNIAELEALGWSVGIIWECSLRDGSFMEQPLVQFITSCNSWVISS
jgi:DNA mismatch endonuclease, patch repair protein